MTGTLSFPVSIPVTYPFTGSYSNPIPDSYSIPNIPIWRVGQEKTMRANLVSFALNDSADFKHESYPSTLPGRRPLNDFLPGRIPKLCRLFFIVPSVAFNDFRYEKHAPLFYRHVVNQSFLFFMRSVGDDFQYNYLI